MDERFFIDELTREERTLVLQRVEAEAVEATGGAVGEPGIEIDVAVASADGSIVGGVNASTRLGVMFLEVLWVADAHRDRDLGAAVVLEAERIARDAGCRAAQTWTFSFQAPRFYEKIGYRRIGLYDGYPGDITEHVMMKRLGVADSAWSDLDGRYRLLSGATSAEMKAVRDGFHEFCVAAVGEAMDGVVIDLALRGRDGRLVGGLHSWTTLQIVAVESVWVEPSLRGRGHARRLLLEAERRAVEEGCISAQTGALSFQSPGFFEACGYGVYGRSEAYPAPYHETYFIKRLVGDG